jgi:hypothetical protein
MRYRFSIARQAQPALWVLDKAISAFCSDTHSFLQFDEGEDEFLAELYDREVRWQAQ